MQRLPTTFALATWTGFLLTVAVLGFEGAAEPPIASLDIASGWAGMSLAPWLWSSILCAIGGLSIVATVFVHRPHREGRVLGETLACVSFGLIGLVAILAPSGEALSLAADLSQAHVWLLLGASFLAVAFDHFIATDQQEEDEEEAFVASITALAVTMGQQTRRYVQPAADGQEERAR